MKLSRRQLFRRTLLATTMASLPNRLVAASRQALQIPPLIESRRGKPVLLGLGNVQTKLLDNHLSEMWGFNGQYLGPTVRVRQGDFVKLNYRNHLPQSVAINLQGVQINSDIMGGIGHSLKPQSSWSPIVPITQPAATCYYQSCSLANTAYQNYLGLVGMWIVEDSESQKAKLPNKYGVNDIPLILQDMSLTAEGVPLFARNEPHFLGNHLFVNGQEAPYLNVARGWVRLRLLNASLSRAYQLQCDDEREFLILAKDQGFLPEPKAVTSVWLGVGERLEILLDLNEGGNVSLLAGKKRNLVDKVGLFFNDNGELTDNTILELRPEGLVSVFNGKPHFSFNQNVSLPSDISEERQFHINAENAMINQKRFDPRRIDVNAKQGSVERWHLQSTAATGFRIQGAKFLVESENNQATPENELVWKDSLWLNQQASILVKFDNTSSNSYPFLFGSADLMQADKGALGLIVVQK